MTEPGGGSDLAALKTTAVRDGDDWVLNGRKTFITNGYQADLVIVAARTDPSQGRQGHHPLHGRGGHGGLHPGRKLDKVGMEESDTAELFFDNVRVPDANRIGDEGMGFIAMMQRLPRSGSVPPVANVAHAKAILEETIEYAKERKAFGQPIGSFQHNKFKIAELGDDDRGRRGLRRRLRRGPRRGPSCRPSTRPRPSGGARRCRTTCSTRASSCTAATAS